MTKTNIYTITVLSFCSALLDFMMMTDIQAVFPRDRIIHIFISAMIAVVAILLFKNIKYENKTAKIISASVIILRMLILFKNFAVFFHTFHGSNTVGIVIFSLTVIFIFWNYIYEKTHLMYSFFIMFYISFTVLVILLSVKELNVANIYSNSQSFYFNIEKLFVFFDIFTISVIVKDKKQRIYVQKNYTALVSLFMIVITILQGLCVSGNLLYSVSPLQALPQIFFTETIKRYDYIFTIYYTFDYFAAVMLYTWSIKTLMPKTKEKTNEII